jgi:hypothetical protein
MSNSKNRKVPGIPDHAVEAATGRPWGYWFDVLDSWGAGEQNHRHIARYLRVGHGLPAWWAQTVTIRYHSERG